MAMNLVLWVKQAINTGVQALRQHIAASLKPTRHCQLGGEVEQ